MGTYSEEEEKPCLLWCLGQVDLLVPPVSCLASTDRRDCLSERPEIDHHLSPTMWEAGEPGDMSTSAPTPGPESSAMTMQVLWDVGGVYGSTVDRLYDDITRVTRP